MSKTIFLDIDGTLINSFDGYDKMSVNCKNTLNELIKEGHDLIVASGRCRGLLLDDIKEYPFSGYLLSNGAYFEYNNKCLINKKFDKSIIEKVIEFCNDNGFVYYLESVDKIYTADLEAKLHLKFLDNWQIPNCFTDDFDIDKVDINIVMIAVNDENDFQLVYDSLGNYFDIAKHNGFASFDLNIKGVSKGHSIKDVVEYLNIDINDTIAFGDGLNDIEMIEEVNLGIAMGNSNEELKKIANYITKSCKDDGITYACKQLNLIK